MEAGRLGADLRDLQEARALDPLHRSIRKPSSFGELSLHARVMTPDLGPAVAVRFVGAARGPGAVGVVASATFEHADVPPLLYARTS